MVGWRGSGRGTGVDRIRHALRARGIDAETINQRWPETNFYEESQQPQPEDLTPDEDLMTPDEDKDVDLTPDEDKDEDLTPDEDKDEDLTPDEDKDVDLTPDEDKDVDLTPDEDKDVDLAPDEKVDDEDDPKDDGPKKPVVQDQPVQEYDIGENVLALWEGRSWFLAHVTEWINGRYNVYFMDGNTKINMSPSSIKPYKSVNPPPRRGEMINKIFQFGEDEEYAGQWKVRRIEGNGFVCTRLTGGDGITKNMETFDIGRVIREYQGIQQTARELGPCVEHVIQGSRRRSRRLRR